jgi:hypothetical protein
MEDSNRRPVLGALFAGLDKHGVYLIYLKSEERPPKCGLLPLVVHPIQDPSGSGGSESEDRTMDPKKYQLDRAHQQKLVRILVEREVSAALKRSGPTNDVEYALVRAIYNPDRRLG